MKLLPGTNRLLCKEMTQNPLVFQSAIVHICSHCFRSAKALTQPFQLLFVPHANFSLPLFGYIDFDIVSRFT